MTTKSVDEIGALTPKHVGGFADRLNITLSYAGIGEYGKLTALARYSELTPSGVKLLFQNDRPPQHLHKFELMTGALTEQIYSFSGRRIKLRQLQEYLLYNSKSPFSDFDTIPEIRSSELLEEFDTVYLGRIYIFMDEVAKENGISLFKDLESGAIKRIVDRVLLLFSEDSMDLKSDTTRELVKSMILLGKSGML